MPLCTSAAASTVAATSSPQARPPKPTVGSLIGASCTRELERETFKWRRRPPEVRCNSRTRVEAMTQPFDAHIEMGCPPPSRKGWPRSQYIYIAKGAWPLSNAPIARSPIHKLVVKWSQLLPAYIWPIHFIGDQLRAYKLDQIQSIYSGTSSWEGERERDSQRT